MKHLWLNTVLNRPWLILLIGMLLITAATMGGKNLYFRGDYKVFFDDDNPQLTAFEHMQSTFNKNENAAIIIAPKSGNVFSKETLTLIKNMTDQAWLTPNSSRVDSITNYQHTWAQEDDLIVEDLVPDLETIDQQTIARAREVALKEPNLVKRMILGNNTWLKALMGLMPSSAAVSISARPCCSNAACSGRNAKGRL